jgi:uncharacterized protein HemY
MSDQANLVAVLVNNATQKARENWDALVSIAVNIVRDKDTVENVSKALANASRIGVDSVRRKILAIQHAQSLGYSEEEIKEFGQREVLGLLEKHKKEERYEELVNLSFRIPGSLRELARQQLTRVTEIVGLNSSEELWEWITAQLTLASDEDLRHSAGMKSIHDTPKTQARQG